MLRASLCACMAGSWATACRRDAPAGSPPPVAVETAMRPASASASASAMTSGAAPSAAGLEPPAAAGEFVDAARVLPRGPVGEWRQSGAVLRSNAANLAQLIDGAAVSYEQYGVRFYAKTEYRKPGTHLVALVEVYSFESALGAFGRYSLNLTDGRDPSTLRTQAIAAGAGGYQGTTQLTFWKGTYLVQVSVSDDSDEPDENAMNAAAREAPRRLTP